MLHSGPGKDAFGTCLATGGISWCFCAPFSQGQTNKQPQPGRAEPPGALNLEGRG